MFLLMTMIGRDRKISIEYLKNIILNKKIPVVFQKS